MMTEKTTIAWRRGMASILTMLAAAAPMVAEAGQNGRRAGAPSADIRAALSFEGDWTSEYPQVNSTPVIPSVCQTAPYVAGPNEVAIVNIDGFVAPSPAAAQNFMVLRLAVSENGGAFSMVPGVPMITEFGNVAAGFVTKRVGLTEGNSYVFGAAFYVYSQMNNAFSVCQGTVSIARVDP